MSSTKLRRAEAWGRARSRRISLVVLALVLLALVGAILTVVPLGGASTADSGPFRSVRTVTAADGTCLRLTATGRLRGTVQRHPFGPSDFSRMRLRYTLEVRLASSCSAGAAPVTSAGLVLFERWWHAGAKEAEHVPTDTVDAGDATGPGWDWIDAGRSGASSSTFRFTRDAVAFQGEYPDKKLCLTQDVALGYGDRLSPAVTMPPVCLSP